MSTRRFIINLLDDWSDSCILSFMPNETFFSLQGQVAVVTGAGQGIGEGIAARLADAGARVAILDTNQSAAEEVAARLEGVGLLCDVRSTPSVQQAMAEVERQLGPIQILVNNAGIIHQDLNGPKLPLDLCHGLLDGRS